MIAAPLRLVGRGRPAAAVSPEVAERFVAEGRTRAEEVVSASRAFRRAGWAVGAVGAGLGLLGLGFACYATVALRPPPPEYIPLDAMGVPRQAVRAVDAPVQAFTDATSKYYLRKYLDHCEVYHPDMAKLTATRCLLLLAPPAQERWAAGFANTNAQSPQRRLGANGSVSVEGIPTYALVGKGRGGTEVWNVQFTKAERRGTERTCTPWLLQVGFQWRPDLEMSDEHRTFNLAGFQVIEFTSQPDPSRRPEC